MASLVFRHVMNGRFNCTSLKQAENLADVSTRMLRSSSGGRLRMCNVWPSCWNRVRVWRWVVSWVAFITHFQKLLYRQPPPSIVLAFLSYTNVNCLVLVYLLNVVHCLSLDRQRWTVIFTRNRWRLSVNTWPVLHGQRWDCSPVSVGCSGEC